jgi:hypothetical protein
VLRCLIPILVALPLLWPAGFCPCHVLGLECAAHHAPRNGSDQDCDCPIIKVLAAPNQHVQPCLPSWHGIAGPVCLPPEPILTLDLAQPDVSLAHPPEPASPIYLTVRALRI